MRSTKTWKAVFAAMSLSVGLAGATTIEVTTIDDELNSDGDCSLREAVQAANTNAPVDACPAGVLTDGGGLIDVIRLEREFYTLTIAGNDEDANATGDLDILDEVVILGAGARETVINANGIDRVFHVVSDSAALEDLTLTDGDARGILADLTGVGGCVLAPGSLQLRRVAITHCTAEQAGGGVAAGFALVEESLIALNTAPTVGGIVGPNASIFNTTISGNTNAGVLAFEPGLVEIFNSTISANGTGVQTVSGGAAELTNTIVSGNGHGCLGSVTSLGFNIDLDGTCGPLAPGDQTVDPLLGPLADNGGPTNDHDLLAGSPAIDAGDDSRCGIVDQRGLGRPRGAACDIGAVEACSNDEDGDGLGDCDELKSGIDPDDPDTDGDLFGDGTEVAGGSDAADFTSLPTPAGPVGGAGAGSLPVTDELDPLF